MLKYIYAMILGSSLTLVIMLEINKRASLEFEAKYSQLVLQSEGLQKEIDKLKKEVNNVVVPDLKEDEVVDYWSKHLK